MNGVLVVVLVFLALMIGGVVGGWAIWPYAEKQGYADGQANRHKHRQEKVLLPAGLVRLPLSRRIRLDRLADPAPLPGEPVFRFAGEPVGGWAAEAAEYELPHQPADGPCQQCGGPGCPACDARWYRGAATRVPEMADETAETVSAD